MLEKEARRNPDLQALIDEGRIETGMDSRGRLIIHVLGDNGRRWFDDAGNPL